VAPDLDPQSVLNSASRGSGPESPELQTVYAPAIKQALLVGMKLATVSGLGALLYDWKSLKTKNDGGNDGA